MLPRAHRTVHILLGSYSHRKPQSGLRKEEVGGRELGGKEERGEKGRQ